MSRILFAFSFSFLTFGSVFVAHCQWTQMTALSGNVQSFGTNGNRLFAGTDAGVFLSVDNGKHWIETDSGLTETDIRAFALTGTSFFAGTYGGGVFVITNNDSHWTAVNSGLTNDSVNTFSIDGSDVFAGTKGGVFISGDFGFNWIPVNNGLTNMDIRAFAMSGKNLICASYGGGIFIAQDFRNGISWTSRNNGLTNTNALTLAVMDSIIFAGTYGGGVFTSSDHGLTWHATNSGLENTYVLDLIVSGSNLFAASGGISLSTNSGASWKKISGAGTGLGSPNVYVLAANGTDIFAGGYSGAIWVRSLSDFAGVSSPDLNLSKFESFPNPFSQSTLIKFSSSGHRFVQVSILNSLGVEVARLFSGSIESGEHSFTWDPHGISAGMYICMVKIGGDVKCIPLILLK